MRVKWVPLGSACVTRELPNDPPLTVEQFTAACGQPLETSDYVVSLQRTGCLKEGRALEGELLHDGDVLSVSKRETIKGCQTR